jgi:hypothetical protein
MKFCEICNLHATPDFAESTRMVLKEVIDVAQDAIFGELHLCSM